MTKLPPLRWGTDSLARHLHHHHRFDAPPTGPAAEMETSRGYPYHCTSSNGKFRSSFRRCPSAIVAEELDGLIADGAQYIYFIDEIFLPYPELLEAIGERNIKFGIQTRIDLWNKPMIDLLGQAGCVSIEAGVESIAEQGRVALDKRCEISTDELTRLLIHARRSVPFVQANLLDSETDNPTEVEAWRRSLDQNGISSNQPVQAEQ